MMTTKTKRKEREEEKREKEEEDEDEEIEKNARYSAEHLRVCVFCVRVAWLYQVVIE